MKRMHKHVMHTLFAVILFSSTSYAAEITPVNAVLFSNETLDMSSPPESYLLLIISTQSNAVKCSIEIH